MSAIPANSEHVEQFAARTDDGQVSSYDYAAAACDHHAGECVADDFAPCSWEQLASIADVAQRDQPTRTKTLQERLAARLRGRYAAINTAIREHVDERDLLGLEGRTSVVEQQAEWSPPAPDRPRFRFARDAQKHDRFLEWLADAQERGVIRVFERDGERYLQRSYTQGLKNAEQWLVEQGFARPEVPAEQAFNLPRHQDTFDRIYTRAFTDLEGITNDVDREISRELTEALAEGVNPNEAARNMAGRVDAVGKHRSTLLARTEMIHAHNESAAVRYSSYGVDQVEVLTADPCDICAGLAAGNPYPVEEARNLVPGRTHPQCVCTIVPVQ